jgi:hypothetical protein
MLTKRDRNQKRRQLEDLQRLRRDNVRLLAQCTSWENIAWLSGLSAGNLRQLAGANAVRQIDNHTAEAIEVSLDLPPRWLSQEHPELRETLSQNLLPEWVY